MARGLAWLPLLVLFFGLAWAGWNEYRKLEAYKLWAQQFERAKYDIYAALGQQENTLTWGKPTRSGVVELQTLDLKAVKQLALESDGQAIALDDEQLSAKGKVTIGFDLAGDRHISIPFTDAQMAVDWLAFLRSRIPSA